MAYEHGRCTDCLTLVIDGIAKDASAVILDYQAEDDFLIRVAISYVFNRAVPVVKADKSLYNDVFLKNKV